MADINTLTTTATLSNVVSGVTPLNKLLGYITIGSLVVYLGWRLGFSLPISYGPLALGLGVLLFVCELISGIEEITNYLGQIRPLPLEKPTIPDEWYPEVDVLVATHDEAVNLLYNTLNACLYLDYPDKSKVRIHLCDDGNRPEMRELALRLGVNYIGMAEPRHAKAGNMNNALAQTSAPLVAFLDADMIPRREFLTEIVPYFYLPKVRKDDQGQWIARTPEEIDPEYKVGFVQTPQNFYNPDLFQYNLYAEERFPNEQIYFFREINTSRNRANAALLCGSNMIISREALAQVGYFSTNNITEDYETGIKIQTAGWTTYALDICLANGLNPPAVSNLIIQRERWGRGCMQTFHNLNPLFNWRIPIARRISYLCAMLYWLSFFCRFVFIIAPILVALFGVFIVECSLGELMVFWLPHYVLHMIAMARLSSKTTTVHWSNTVDTIMFPFLVVPILLDMVGVRLRRFKVTDKNHQSNTNSNRMLVLPHLILFGMSVLGIAFCLLDIIQHRSFYNMIILFWLVVNGKSLLLGIFFMLGRTNDRLSYRFHAALPAEIDCHGFTYKGVTGDVSEGGLSVILDYPACLPDGRPMTVRLSDRQYAAQMRCSLVQVKNTRDGKWQYSLKLEHISEESMSNYRQIIYERDPSLPEEVNETLPVVEDIKVNLDKRLQPPVAFTSRKLPRIAGSIKGVLPDGSGVSLEDFNYNYVRITPAVPLAPDRTVAVTVAEGVDMILTAPGENPNDQNGNLAAVVNRMDWMRERKYMDVLAEWTGGVKPELCASVQQAEGRVLAQNGLLAGVKGRGPHPDGTSAVSLPPAKTLPAGSVA